MPNSNGNNKITLSPFSFSMWGSHTANQGFEYSCDLTGCLLIHSIQNYSKIIFIHKVTITGSYPESVKYLSLTHSITKQQLCFNRNMNTGLLYSICTEITPRHIAAWWLVHMTKGHWVLPPAHSHLTSLYGRAKWGTVMGCQVPVWRQNSSKQWSSLMSKGVILFLVIGF